MHTTIDKRTIADADATEEAVSTSTAPDTDFADGYSYTKFEVEAPATLSVSFDAFLRESRIVTDADVAPLIALDAELDIFLAEELKFSQPTVARDLKQELIALRNEDKPLDGLELSRGARLESARAAKRICRERRKAFVAEKMLPAVVEFLGKVMPYIRSYVVELQIADEKHCAQLGLAHAPSWPTQCAERTLSQLETRLANYKSNRSFGNLSARHGLHGVVIIPKS